MENLLLGRRKGLRTCPEEQSWVITGCTFSRSFYFFCCRDLTVGYSSKIFNKLSIKYWFECFRATNYSGIFFAILKLDLGNSEDKC